ncbi:nucleoside triphosphate hydrolase protein [Wolfiporia cocos MD-104 SS10]|uniref:Nucleoside triphosphate hydrolase protein n=1 Tax=Wolfiporia cocos (strain MD-104) TaxID=742152 RepID=A0A2H3JMX3_WOLCO|nr:nucleoside triphosphate hydrolase protein [Wolfiporia cocos MD-104 SS10]
MLRTWVTSSISLPEACSPAHESPGFRKKCVPKVHGLDAGSGSPSHIIHQYWLQSRLLPSGRKGHLAPGAHRPLNLSTLQLAYKILSLSAVDLLKSIWDLHPWRFLLMVSIEFLRGIMPAYRGYSQALLINELQSLIVSERYTWSRLAGMIASELLGIGAESIIDSIASTNENIVRSASRFALEYRQMEQRVRLDLPTLADPVVRDLLQESELFVRSFDGMSSFGLFSTFDFLRILTLFSELVSHFLVLTSLPFSVPHLTALFFSILSAIIPLVLPWTTSGLSSPEDYAGSEEARMAAKQDKMRHLAYSDTYRPEVLLFGLGPWILKSWAQARKTMLGLGRSPRTKGPSMISLPYLDFSGMFVVMQNIPLVLLLNSPSASLGAFTLYRSSVQSLFVTVRNLIYSVRMAYQGIFLMGAFSAAMTLQPRLHPQANEVVEYQASPRGAKIEAKNLFYAYPGSQDYALRNINLTIKPGETLAIVGYNGSGKSTLAKVLLRILDFDSGELLLNNADIRKIRPEAFHAHVTAMFQDFAKFDASARENIGLGHIQDMRSPRAIDAAIRLAGAAEIVQSLPRGLKTKLDIASHEQSSYAFRESYRNSFAHQHHGLSGGEWQRIALSRAFMRARRPEIDLILFDEPTSSLDAHAQNWIFESLEKCSHSPEGKPTKTVIFITHRLATARRADRIAMMENGTITELGTHEELLTLNGQYAALYRASI